MLDQIRFRPRLLRFTQGFTGLLVHAALLALLLPLIPPAGEPGPGADATTALHAGPGITVHSEVVDLWLPQAWFDLAKAQGSALNSMGEVDLRRLLGDAWSARVCYAISVRAHQADGGSARLGFLRDLDPGRDDLHELLDVLRAAAGLPPGQTSLDYSAASLHLVPSMVSGHDILTSIRDSSKVPDLSPGS